MAFTPSASVDRSAWSGAFSIPNECQILLRLRTRVIDLEEPLVEDDGYE